MAIVVWAPIMGFFTAVVSVAPPGLLNMTAAKIAAKTNKDNALFFAFGASTTVAFQTYFSVLFARYITTHPQITKGLQWTGVVIFSLLTIYFFVKGKKSKSSVDTASISKRKRYYWVNGFLLSALNLFPIPFYVLLSVWLSKMQLFQFQTLFMLVYALGVSLGAWLVFYVYILFFKQKTTLAQKPKKVLQNMNYILGSITATVAVLTIIKILC